LMELEVMSDSHLQITSQTRYPLR